MNAVVRHLVSKQNLLLSMLRIDMENSVPKSVPLAMYFNRNQNMLSSLGEQQQLVNIRTLSEPELKRTICSDSLFWPKCSCMYNFSHLCNLLSAFNMVDFTRVFLMLTQYFQKSFRENGYIFSVIYQDKFVSLLCGKGVINLYEREETGGEALFIYKY